MTFQLSGSSIFFLYVMYPEEMFCHIGHAVVSFTAFLNGTQEWTWHIMHPLKVTDKSVSMRLRIVTTS